MIRTMVVLSLLAAPLPLAAQGNVNDLPPGSCNPPQGGRASFSSSADNVRLVLCAGVKYLAETNRGGPLRLELRPLTPGVQMPQIREGMMGTGVEGGKSWVLDAAASGIFEIRVVGVQGGVPVDLTITPRVDKSKEKAAKDSTKAAEKARKDAEKAAKDSVKAAEKARKEAEKKAKANG